ncbi:fluoride efflux transporter CrcB [Candidatus Babeliales bacterium]|nr:fluoride efflux transporter CrcB [Candidatus Babeliales bacterium]
MFNFKNILIVSIGGILGTLSRYFVYLSAEYFALTNFPIAVLFINSIGSFFIGFLFAMFNSLEIYKTYKLFCFVGFLGAFTTFSAYSLDTINLFFENKFKLGFLNILLNNILSLVFVVLGFWLAKILYIFFTKNSV